MTGDLDASVQGVAAYAILESLLVELVEAGVLEDVRVDALLERAAAAFDPHPNIVTGESEKLVAIAIRLMKSDSYERK